jgi:hypothetical protein
MADFKDRKAVASEKAIQLETFKQHLEEKKERLTEVETLLKSSAQALPVVEKELRELEAEKRAILEGIIKRERESAMDADSIDYAVTKINEIKTADARDKQANSSVENFREKASYNTSILWNNAQILYLYYQSINQISIDGRATGRDPEASGAPKAVGEPAGRR